jgi:hypothetical protein
MRFGVVHVAMDSAVPVSIGTTAMNRLFIPTSFVVLCTETPTSITDLSLGIGIVGSSYADILSVGMGSVWVAGDYRYESILVNSTRPVIPGGSEIFCKLTPDSIVGGRFRVILDGRYFAEF